MSSIASIRAREILDSRGNPTVEVDVELADGSRGRAAVPSGASSGAFEAVELRDGDPRRFRGLGVTRAVENVERRIAPAVAGLSAADQSAVDRVLIEVDGTPNKGGLGANAVLGVSLAVARAAAASSGQPLYQYLAGDAPVTLPAPMFNIINGGRHADDSTDFQEFMVVAAGFDRFSDALRAGVETYHALGDILRGRRAATGLGDEGGFAPPLTTNEEAVELALTAIEEAGYVPGEHCFLAMDVAASELVLDDGRYALLREGAILEPGQLLDQYERWTRQYPIISIEDGLAEEDWPHWQSLTERLGASVQIVGDDLFVTNTDRLRRGIETASANAVSGQAQPDRHRVRDAGRGEDGEGEGLGHGDQPQVGRDWGRLDRRPRCGHGRGPDQGRGSCPGRAHRQVQPAAPDRGGAGRQGGVRRARCLQGRRAGVSLAGRPMIRSPRTGNTQGGVTCRK